MLKQISKKAVPVPVSIKTRSFWSKQTLTKLFRAHGGQIVSLTIPSVLFRKTLHTEEENSGLNKGFSDSFVSKSGQWQTKERVIIIAVVAVDVAAKWVLHHIVFFPIAEEGSTLRLRGWLVNINLRVKLARFFTVKKVFLLVERVVLDLLLKESTLTRRKSGSTPFVSKSALLQENNWSSSIFFEIFMRKETLASKASNEKNNDFFPLHVSIVEISHGAVFFNWNLQRIRAWITNFKSNLISRSVLSKFWFHWGAA